MSRSQRIVAALGAMPPPAMVALSVAAVGALGVADVVTGSELSSSVFYSLPVGTAAWYAGHRWGVTLGILAAAVWYLADLSAGGAYSASWIPVWNATVRLGFFLIITRLLVLLRSALEAQRTLAEVDPLTGLANRRAFIAAVRSEVARSARYGGAISLAYVDLDDFKAINDHWGHRVGDDVLETVGGVVSEMMRQTDLPARLGGDEFAVLFPETEEGPAREVADKMRARLEAAMQTAGWPVGFSMGVVTASSPPDAYELIRTADDLMYEVKRSGKGRTSYRRWLHAGAKPG